LAASASSLSELLSYVSQFSLPEAPPPEMTEEVLLLLRE
jgi:hypothetical protein